jgi:hypothetical protein
VGFVSRRRLTLELAQGLLCVPPIVNFTFARRLVTLVRKDQRHSPAALAFLAALGKEMPGATVGDGDLVVAGRIAHADSDRAEALGIGERHLESADGIERHLQTTSVCTKDDRLVAT